MVRKKERQTVRDKINSIQSSAHARLRELGYRGYELIGDGILGFGLSGDYNAVLGFRKQGAPVGNEGSIHVHGHSNRVVISIEPYNEKKKGWLGIYRYR